MPLIYFAELPAPLPASPAHSNTVVATVTKSEDPQPRWPHHSWFTRGRERRSLGHRIVGFYRVWRNAVIDVPLCPQV